MASVWRASVSWASLFLAATYATPGHAQGAAVQLQEIVVAPTPVPTTAGININKVPAAISRVTSKDFTERKSPSVTDAITSHVPAAIAINVDGSDLSPDLFFRGFNVSRISGSTNGLAVYQNGVRINEAFGDGVNLDLLPPIILDHADVFTNNPVFGLNALGGAVNFTPKNGFTFQGGDATILGGSFGRVNGNFEYGKQVGNYSFYVAADGYRDGGYRPFGAQNAERAYADLGYRSQDSEVHVIGSYGRSLLGVQGVTPKVLVNQQYNSVFTTPQTTENQAGLAQLTGSFQVAPHWTINSNFYIRKFDQYHVDGNDADVEQCDDAPRRLCLDEDAVPDGTPPGALQFRYLGGSGANSFVPFTRNLPTINGIEAYGTTARTATHTETAGTQQQAVNKDTFYGHDNYFVVGGSIDASRTNFASTTSLGMLNSQFQNVESGFPGAGAVLSTIGQLGFAPTFITSDANYFGVFALDTFNVTKALAVTAGARYNLAQISVHDVTGIQGDLNSQSQYQRINPVVGATYEFAPAFTVYGGYSEANRAPTPLETSCANPLRPCVLETALVADPPLQQVVSHTVEAGARGAVALPDQIGGTFTYKGGYFRTKSDNDIIALPSVISGQGTFTNVQGSLRQGIEAGIIYDRGPVSLYANYALIDATYQFSAALSSPNNPFANAAGNIFVNPGNRIPGIPRQLGKVGFEYRVTDRFRIGSDITLVGSQYYVADDSNQNPMLPFYYRVDARASYQVTDHVQVFVLSTNLTDNRYATYGTFYEPSTSGAGVSPTLAANAALGTPNQQSITVAQPLSFYGGVKVTF